MADCLTRQQLLAMAHLDCTANPNASASIRFAEAFNPLLILGYSLKGDLLFRPGISKGN